MRIVYFSRDYTPHDHRFLTKLAETDHKIYYLRLERGSVQSEDRSLPPAVEIIPWSGGQSPARLQDAPKLIFELRRILSSIRPDLVHAGPVQRSAFLAALAGAQTLVSMSWGYDLLHDAERNRWWRAATRFTFSRSAAFVGDCETIRGLAVKYGMDPDRIVTFPWGVDLAHFNPDGRTAPVASEVFNLLSTRSWSPIYGVETIARAFAEAASRIHGLRLAMIGSGPLVVKIQEILREFTAEAAIDLATGSERDQSLLMPPAVPERVIFPGRISQAGLPRFYRSADLYVSASFSDGSSISLLEAMACGCPVLVSDIPGNREWVIPGVNGWLFPPGDVPALAAAIEYAFENRACLAEMGRAARRTVEARADWERNFPKLLEAYHLAQRS